MPERHCRPAETEQARAKEEPVRLPVNAEIPQDQKRHGRGDGRDDSDQSLAARQPERRASHGRREGKGDAAQDQIQDT